MLTYSVNSWRLDLCDNILRNKEGNSRKTIAEFKSTLNLVKKKKSDAIGNQISDEKDTFRMQLKESDDETSEFKDERNKI